MPSSRRRRLRVVLDSNVWVSAAIWGGRLAEVVELAERGTVEIFISAEILSEINKILDYEKLRRIYEGGGVKKGELIASIASLAKFVKATAKFDVVVDDPPDNRVLECAVDAGADYVVSGDTHLLKLREYRSVKVVSPSEFLAHVRRERHES